MHGKVRAVIFPVLFAAFVALSTAQLQADALHGMCGYSSPACQDNGTVTPVFTSSPTYGFTSSPAGLSGTLDVITLIPDNITGANSESFSIFGGATSPAASTLVNMSAWTSNKVDLSTFVGLGKVTPSSPLGAFLPTTQSFDSSATGYYVYLADLGTNTLGGTLATTLSLNDGSFDLPVGSSIFAFLDTSKGWVATANSGQISIDGASPIPEPASLALFGFGLLGLACFTHWKLRHAN